MENIRDIDGEGGGIRGGGYKPPTPAKPTTPGAPGTTTDTSAAGIAQNVKAEGLSNDPEAKPYDPSVDWNPGAWAGSGQAAEAAPKIEPIRKPIGEPIRRPIGGPRPVGGPIRAFPHYGQSFTARGGASGTGAIGTFDSGAKGTAMPREDFLSGE